MQHKLKYCRDYRTNGQQNAIYNNKPGFQNFASFQNFAGFIQIGKSDSAVINCFHDFSE